MLRNPGGNEPAGWRFPKPDRTATIAAALKFNRDFTVDIGNSL
jgi:hypothetical protein